MGGITTEEDSSEAEAAEETVAGVAAWHSWFSAPRPQRSSSPSAAAAAGISRAKVEKFRNCFILVALESLGLMGWFGVVWGGLGWFGWLAANPMLR